MTCPDEQALIYEDDFHGEQEEGIDLSEMKFDASVKRGPQLARRLPFLEKNHILKEQSSCEFPKQD